MAEDYYNIWPPLVESFYGWQMQYGGDTSDQYVCRYVLELEPMDFLTATSSISNRLWNKFIEHTIVEYYLVNSFSGSPGGRHMVLSWLCQQVFYILLTSLSDLTSLVYPCALEHHYPVKGSPPTVAPVDRKNHWQLNAAQVKLTVERLFACIQLLLAVERLLNCSLHSIPVWIDLQMTSPQLYEQRFWLIVAPLHTPYSVPSFKQTLKTPIRF